MKLISGHTVYYPMFSIGCRPRVVRGECRIVESSSGKRFIMTPFGGCLDWFEGVNPTYGYQTNPWRVKDYLRSEYPHWKAAEPIMDLWAESKHYTWGSYAKECKLADILGVDLLSHGLSRLARGHRSFTTKQIKAALKAVKNAGYSLAS
jgi:hypothetical protein